MRKLFGVAATLFSTIALLAAACGGVAQPQAQTSPVEKPAPKPKLVIAIQPTANPDQLSAESKELEQYLEQKVDADVQIIVPTLFAGVIEALRFGHAQAAFMSAWPAALAAKHAGTEVALAEVREVVIGQDKQEKPFYFSYWVTRKDSQYTSLSDLKGKKVAFSSPLSTSGYVFPMARLVELGLVTSTGKDPDPKEFFGDVVFAGCYAQAWEALKQGQVDATIIAGDVSEKLYREVLDGTRILEQQGPIPSHAVVFSKDLSEPLRSQLSAALLDLGSPERRPLMRKFISGIFIGFQASNNETHLGALARALDSSKLKFTEALR